MMGVLLAGTQVAGARSNVVNQSRLDASGRITFSKLKAYDG